jgi:hypothetical protein
VGVRDLDLGSYSAAAIVADGSVRTWALLASDRVKQVEGISGATQISCGQSHCCARVTGEDLRCWGRNGQGQLGDVGAGTGGDRDRAGPVRW